MAGYRFRDSQRRYREEYRTCRALSVKMSAANGCLPFVLIDGMLSGVGVNILEMIFIALVVVLVMLVWFFINRASVRANEQIKLLHEIVEQQRQQLALLNMLVPQEVREEKAEDADALQIQEPDDVLAFKNVIPER